MARSLRELARRIDAFQDRFGRGVSWLMLLMVLVVFVRRRHALRLQQELASSPRSSSGTCSGIVYLLAAGYTMLYDEHVRVDILYSALVAPEEGVVRLRSATCVFFYPVGHHGHVHDLARSSGTPTWSCEGSPDPGGIPLRWLLKSVIIIGFVLLMLQGISQTIKNFYWAMGWEEPEARAKEIH